MNDNFKNVVSAEILEEREELFTEIIKKNNLAFHDSRRISGGNIQFSLMEILFVWVVGWIYGSQTYEKIALDAELKLPFLKQFFPFHCGAPRKSTIARVIGIIDPEKLEKLLSIVGENIKKAAEKFAEENDQLKTIALDGKTNCGAQKTEENANSLHIVGAFDTQLGIMLTQNVVPAKTNEITAIKSIVSSLEISGYTITVDAMGTQRLITELIRSRGANYILSVKGNHKMLHLAITVFFGKEENLKKCESYRVQFKRHGRTEQYECYVLGNVLNELPWLASRGWIDLNSIIMIKHFEILKDGSITASTRYFITSLDPDAEKIFYAIRSHWMIESAHWTLDVTFNEDNRIVWNRTMAKNESIIRRIVFNLLTVLRASFKKPTSKNLPTYGAIQRRLFLQDDMMKSLLLSAFK